MKCPNCKKDIDDVPYAGGVLECTDCGCFKLNADGTAEPCEKPKFISPASPGAVPANTPQDILPEKTAKKPASLNIRIEFEDE